MTHLYIETENSVNSLLNSANRLISRVMNCYPWSPKRSWTWASKHCGPVVDSGCWCFAIKCSEAAVGQVLSPV
jgi:hypothetical protein